MYSSFLKWWPFFAIIAVVFLFFWKVFFLGQVPIPADLVVGAYYPWLDYKWGYDAGVPVKNPVTSDVVSIVYPLRSYAVDSLKKGIIPLWNPYMFTGSPLFADFQVGVFSPTIIFYFFLSKIWAWTAQIVMQPILAATFTYIMLRNFKLGKLESFFGGIFYAFSSFNIIWMEWNANTLVAAFIPLIIFLIDKMLVSERYIWGAILSVVICTQIFSGYPQLFLFTLIASAIFVVFKHKNLSKVKFIQIIFSFLLGIILSSILSFPALELIINSQRKYQVLTSDLIYLPWKHLVTFLAPDYFGNPATGNYFGIGNYAINSGYSGVIVLVLAIVGAYEYKKRVEIKYFFWLAILALLLALPTPLASAVFNSHIPGISASSNTRILVLVNLSLAVLSSFGIAKLIKNEKLKNYWMVLTPLAILLVLGFTTLIQYSHKSISFRNVILPIIFSSVACLLILFRQKYFMSIKINKFIIITISIVAVVELLRFGWKYTPFSPANLIFPNTPIFQFLENDNGIHRVSPGNVVPMNMLMPYGIESVSGYDAVYPIWWARLLAVIRSNDPNNVTLSYYAPFDKYESKWFDILNNKYLIAYNSEKENKKNSDNDLYEKISKLDKFDEIYSDKSVAIFKNNKFTSRSFFVTEWEHKSDEDILKALVDPNFQFNNKVFVDRDINLNQSKENNSNVSYKYYSAEKSNIVVHTDKDGLLFVSDSWYPGWKAKIDGMDTQIIRANYAFRAVPLIAGDHEVEFFYDPESLRLGSYLSLFSVILLFAIIAYDVKKYWK